MMINSSNAISQHLSVGTINQYSSTMLNHYQTSFLQSALSIMNQYQARHRSPFFTIISPPLNPTIHHPFSHQFTTNAATITMLHPASWSTGATPGGATPWGIAPGGLPRRHGRRSPRLLGRPAGLPSSGVRSRRRRWPR